MNQNYLNTIEQFKITNKTTLYLSSSDIIDLSPLKDLPSLTELYLSSTHILDLTPLKGLKNLEKLFISNTKINDLTPIQELHNLKLLDISHTQVLDLIPIKNLKNLEKLFLNSTLITDLTPINELHDLKLLELSNSLVSDLSPLKEIIKKDITVMNQQWERGSGIFIKDCPIENPPISIINSGTQSILNYFLQLEEQGYEPIYEARLLIVGEPGAGKTSLMNKLIDLNYNISENHPISTVGINIYSGWQFNFTKDNTILFKANIWDFGGQEIQYMTHQFFLSGRVLYVLLSDNRVQNTKFPYWFKTIHLLGKDYQNKQSPILVILNDRQQHNSITNYNHDGYCTLYPNTKIDFIKFDLSKNDGSFNILNQQIQTMLSELPHIGDKLPKLWSIIRNDLEELSKTKNHITDEDINNLCRIRGLKDKSSISTLNYYLHDLGIIINFQEDRNLQDFIILNPKWAVDAVYCILENEKIVNNMGFFDEKFLSEIWDSKYSKTEQKNLLSLMMKDKFEICYEYSKGKFVAPQFLKDIKVNYTINSLDSLKFYYQYEFMPKGIITRLIVRLSENILQVNEESLVSQKSVVFSKDGCQIFVSESDFEHKGEIKIEVSGEKNNRREIMWWIRDEIKQIHKKWFNSLTPKQFIPCNCIECVKSIKPHFFDYTYLQRCLGRKENVICELSLSDVNVLNLIDGIFDNFFEDIHISQKQLNEINIILEKYFEKFKGSISNEIMTQWKEINQKPYSEEIKHKGKFKLSLPLIPSILTFENEVEISSDLKKIFNSVINKF